MNHTINKLSQTVARYFVIVFFIAATFASCSKSNSSGGGTTPPPPPTPPPAQEAATPSPEIMLQTFYWDVTPIGGWWDVINSKLDVWKASGVTGLWLPVISKGASGGLSMGYDPYDYFDFGQFNQMGSTETRFGSFSELTNLLTNAKAKGFKLIADIVINHNSGGTLETSPYAAAYYTKFTPLSGKFNRNYEDFHPNGIHSADLDKFGGFPDLCHDAPNVKDWLWIRADGMAKYYKNNLGFDGWRFDFVKGFSPNVVKDWLAAVGGISIGEFYDGNVTLVNNWLTAANSSAFDFPLMFALKDAFNNSNLTLLDGKGLIAINPSKAYTFVANHDVDDINPQNKLKAYAFIMASEGTPFIFYKDYEVLDRTQLNALITIKKTLAAGTTTKLYSSTSEYVFRRNGTPGLVAYFNAGISDLTRSVQTTWANKVLKDYTGANPDVTTDASGIVTISCKAYSYSIYAPK
jgi:alpha-amylase